MVQGAKERGPIPEGRLMKGFLLKGPAKPEVALVGLVAGWGWVERDSTALHSFPGLKISHCAKNTV